MPTAATGRILAGRYRLISELGVGGMGVTYRAWDDDDAVPVVVKMPKREAQSDEEALRRFAREIDAMLALPHEHIVPITDHGDDDGCPYVVMRFLPGGSLADHRRRDDDGNPLANPAGMLHFWLPAIAEALDSIHQRGMLHRDVKPGNIFFDGFWNAFLGDFGIAKVVDSSGGLAKEQTLTATMVAIGTPEYMAPELFSPKAKPDGRADQYALAVTVYEMLCGVRPFTGSKAHIVVEHSSMQVPPLHTKGLKLPQSLCDAIERALAKTPQERFGTCAEFVRAALRDVTPLIPELDITRLLCPGCKNLLKLPQRAAGRTGKCPKCREPIDVAEDLGSLWLKSEERGAGTAPAKQSLMPLDEPLTQATNGEMWRWGMLALATCCGLALGYAAGAMSQRMKLRAELTQAENQWRQAGEESLAKANSEIAELKRTLATRDAELTAASANASVPSDAIRWGGHAYYFVTDVVTQQDAVNQCRDMGGYLARIETADEHRLVMAAFQGLAQFNVSNTDPRFWIDGSDRSQEGEWRLSDGSLMKFLGWRQGEPNSEGEDEDGLQIMAGGWNDISMARQCGFVCEWEGVQSSEETTIEAAVASVLPSWEQRIYLQTADRVPTYDGTLPRSRDSANLNDSRNWLVSKGAWSFTKSGQLHGEGDSGIRFRRTLPWPSEISFKMRVLSGMRPRVALGGTDIYFGNEGYEPTIWLYGNVKDPTGSPFRYKPNTTYDVTVRASQEVLRLLIDDKEVGTTAIEKRPDSVTLELSGGDGWSPGVTEFWNFNIKPSVITKPPATVVNSIGMKLTLVPAGTFTMGAANSAADERPHQVTLTSPYYLGVHEVTNAQWKRVMGSVPSLWQDDDRPVEQVNWGDAVDFCQKLSALPAEKSAGRTYRLPTEAEWEYACRAGTTTTYSFGDDESGLGDYGWFFGNSDKQAQPAGLKKPNAWGLYDMHGNVWELCSDWYGNHANGPVSDPTGSSSGTFRVYRGGGWDSSDWGCRSANRGGNGPSSQRGAVGLRVALTPSDANVATGNVSRSQTKPEQVVQQDSRGQEIPNKLYLQTELPQTPEEQTLVLSMIADGSGVFTFRRNAAVYKHKHWTAPTDVRINGNRWENLSETPPEWLRFARSINPVVARIVAKEGRDSIALESSEDGFDLYVCDSPNGGAPYTVTIGFGAE
jgi:formylglycine-generating enzyme required for sulfatase activity/serine/threonine protein kinase